MRPVSGYTFDEGRGSPPFYEVARLLENKR